MPNKQDIQSKRRYYIGILTLLFVVFIWVATSFITNSIFGEQDFEKPFFITYYSTSTFTLYLIPFLLLRLWQVGRSWMGPASKSTTDNIDTHTTERLLSQDQEQELEGDIHTMDDHGNHTGNNGNEEDVLLEKMTLHELVRISACFCVLWFIANYCTNASLAYTTVGSSTILSSMSGDIFALIGAIFYGAYTVLLKRWIGDESRIDMPTFFGFVGLFNVSLLWPLFFILHWSGGESFALPYHSKLWIMITVNAFIGTFLSDYLWLLSTLLTSPLVVTLGITLTVPLALIGDIILKHILPGVQYITGACLVVAGFLVVNISSLQDQAQSKSENQEDGEETHEMIPSGDF